MKLYRNHPGSEAEGSDGYEWFETKREAVTHAAKKPEDYTWSSGEIAEEFVFQWNRTGVVRLLNYVASYNDNG